MWMLIANRIFSVKSLYLHLVKSDVGFPHKFMWKVKVPAKIKFFLWLLNKKSILTRDNLLKRGSKGDKHCVLCGKEESIDHLFFSCSVARLIWSLVGCAFDLKQIPRDLNDCFENWLKKFNKNDKRLVLTRTSALLWPIWNCKNDIIFGRKNINDPYGIIKRMCNWIIDWAVLQRNDPEEKMLMLGQS